MRYALPTVALLLCCSVFSACGEMPSRPALVTSPSQPPPAPLAGSAQQLFGASKLPAQIAGPSVIGSYAKGCVARAQALPLDAPHWQVMRPSRNRYWGHPSLISYIEKLAGTANANGWRGLLVGDLGQPRGGPMLTGHASHQAGLDVDIWLWQMPANRYGKAEREALPAPSMLTSGRGNRPVLDHDSFTAAHVRLIKAAAQPDTVERVFVNPLIKQALCRSAGSDRAWLGKVRPWRGHDDHIHVRLACPPGEALCEPQEPPPDGDGCGAELTSWLRSRDWLPGEGPEPKMQWTPMSAMPAACLQVLKAPEPQRTARR